jgi:hypothetical protein
MFGPFIETQFQHIEFENELLNRRLETLRLFETEHESQARPRRSLARIFGRLAPRPELRAPFGRSPLAPS